MSNARWLLYEFLIDQARGDERMSQLLLGINWSVAMLESANADTASRCGLCFSPPQIPRTNPWAGTLQGRSVSELAEWIMQWDTAAAVVGALAINAAINSRSSLIAHAHTIEAVGPAHLRVFNYFRERLVDKKVVVIGHYPQLEPFPEAADWQCLERNMQTGDLPDTAADYLLPAADWVFITASSIVNKSLPQLLQLAVDAEVVLMGPSLPWMEGWREFGVNHLAGVEVLAPERLCQIVAEGGGTRIFDESCRYRVLTL